MINFKQIREETGHYAKAEEHLSKANDADASGKKASFHAHMAEYHDELSQWHESKGRSATADKHADKADYHHEKSIDLGRGVHEARDTKQELRDAMTRHTRSAIAAKSEGDNEKVKVHQAYINKIKDKLGKMEAMGEEYIEEASPRAQAAFDELDTEISNARSGKSTTAKDFDDEMAPGMKDMRARAAAKRAAETPAQRDDRRAATAAKMATPAPDGSKRVSPDDQMDRDMKWFKSQTTKPNVAEQFIGTGDSSSMQMSKDIATNRARLNMMRSIHGDTFTDKKIPDHDEHDIKITPNEKGGYRTSVTVTPRSAKKSDMDSSPPTEPKDKTNNTKSYMDSSPLTDPKDKTNNTKSYMDSSPLTEPKDKKYKPKMQDMGEERTETKNAKGEVTSWKDESDWRKSSKVKSGIGKVTNLSDKARRETEKLAKPKMSEEVDDEGSMAKGQLNRMIDQATNLVRIMDDKKQLDGWVQSKLTMASDYLDSAHDYLMHSKQDVDKK